MAKRPNIKKEAISRSKLDTYSMVIRDKNGKIIFNGPKRLKEDVESGAYK